MDIELVCTTLNGVTKPWDIFVESVVAHDHMPHGIVFGTILYTRRPIEGMYRGVHLATKMKRRMWI